MLPQNTKVYFAVQPADLRRSFDGLAAMASAVLGKNPAQGGLFLFLNKRGDQVRVLFRDRQGWCILSKRLEHARFRRPRLDEATACWETDGPTLMRFLEDIELARSPRGQRRHTASPAASSSASNRPLHLVEPIIQ
jgi:transposase